MKYAFPSGLCIPLLGMLLTCACGIPSEVVPPGGSDASDAGGGTDGASLDGAVDAGTGTDATTDAAETDAAATDAGADSGPTGTDAGCTPGPFGTPVNVGAPNHSGGDSGPALSADGLTLYWSQGLGSSHDLFEASRPTTADPFGSGSPIASLNMNGVLDGWPIPSADGLTLYFTSERAGDIDIWMATRPSVGAPWGSPQAVANVNSGADDWAAAVSADELTLYISSNRGGGSGGDDIWAATRPDVTMPFGTPVNLMALNSGGDEWDVDITTDTLTAYVTSDRGGGAGNFDIWVATRTSTMMPFDPPISHPTLNTSSMESSVGLSRDDLELIFASNRGGGAGSRDLWSALRPCP